MAKIRIRMLNMGLKDGVERYENITHNMTLEREYGKTPNGNPMNGKWVLRRNGEMIDFNQYRNDIAEHWNLELF